MGTTTLIALVVGFGFLLLISSFLIARSTRNHPLGRQHRRNNGASGHDASNSTLWPYYGGTASHADWQAPTASSQPAASQPASAADSDGGWGDSGGDGGGGGGGGGD